VDSQAWAGLAIQRGPGVTCPDCSSPSRSAIWQQARPRRRRHRGARCAADQRGEVGKTVTKHRRNHAAEAELKDLAKSDSSLAVRWRAQEEVSFEIQGDQVTLLLCLAFRAGFSGQARWRLSMVGCRLIIPADVTQCR